MAVRALETSEGIARLEAIIARLDIFIELQRRVVDTILQEYKKTAYMRDMEYYDFDESVALPVTTTTTTPHEFKERPVKFMWIYAAGANIRISLDKATSGESMIVPNGAIISVRKKTRRVYGQAVVGAGTLYIWGFW